MIIKSISLNNIRSYLNQTINFPLGSTLLSGDVGSGKSTVLLAIDFALFGIRRGELSGEELLRHGKSSGSIELNMSIGGKNVRIKRTLKRNKDSVVQEAGFIEVDGIRSEKTVTELRAIVLEMIGYPQIYITKNPIIFNYTVYTQQDEMKRICTNSQERLDILTKVFGIDKYRRISENSRILLTELRAMKREFEAFARDLDIKLSERNKKTEEREKAKKEFDSENTKLSEINSLLEKKKSEMNEISEKMNVLNAEKQGIEKMRADKKWKSERISKIDNEISSWNKKLDEVGKELERKIEFPKFNQQEIFDLVMLLESEKTSMSKEEAVLSSEIKKLEDILSQGICSFCEQPVSDIGAFKKRIDGKTENREKIIHELERKEAKLAEYKKIQDDLKSYAAEIEKRKIHEKNYNDLISTLKRAEDEKSLLTNDIEIIAEELKKTELRIIAYGDIENIAKKLRQEIDKISIDKISLERIVSKLQQQIESIDAQISSLEKEIFEKTEAKNKISYIGEIIGWFDSYFVNLMGIIEKHVMSAIQKEFNHFFQEWFSTLMSDELSVRIDDSFSPIIEQDGYQTNYENLSGGEKTSVALAYRLALNKIINSLIETIKTKDIIILDEPTDGFSTDQLDRIRDVLDKLNLKQMIIVSHEPKIDTFVDSVIRFYKENHVSRVLE